MKIGLPKEIKQDEFRVAATPSGVRMLVGDGNKVFVQKGAGEGSFMSDAEYKAAGAKIVPTIEDVYEAGDMILKVKEPLAPELPLMRKGQLFFTYLHLSADEKLTRDLMKREIIGVAYETIQLPDGSLPLLVPMSEVAGRLAMQVGISFLERRRGGRGILLSGLAGVPPGDVVIIGGGVVGLAAAKVAVGLGAQVTIIDRSVPRLRFIDEVIMQGRVITVVSSPETVERSLSYADLVIGAVLVAGARAPKVITKKHLKKMKPGSIIVDVAIDQGGCCETSHVTTHTDPVYTVDGVIHYCVGNMPAAVPRTSTMALTNETLPYARKLAALGFEKAVTQSAQLASGANLYKGFIVHPNVAETFRIKCHELSDVI